MLDLGSVLALPMTIGCWPEVLPWLIFTIVFLTLGAALWVCTTCGCADWLLIIVLGAGLTMPRDEARVSRVEEVLFEEEER